MLVSVSGCFGCCSHFSHTHADRPGCSPGNPRLRGQALFFFPLRSHAAIMSRQKKMKTLRWFACYFAAGSLSLVAWLAIARLLPDSHWGPSFFDSVIGLAPVVIRAAIPALVMVIAGAWLSPSKGRKVAFVFFALSLLSSAGTFETLAAQSDSKFWVSANAGLMLGAFVGLLLALRHLDVSVKEPNQSPDPTRPFGPSGSS